MTSKSFPHVLYPGTLGSFSSLAARRYFPADALLEGVPTFEEVAAHVDQGGKSTFGILPIENSLAGSVHLTYELLEKSGCQIVGETVLKIAHQLVGIPGDEDGFYDGEKGLLKITRVLSHPLALDQCAGFLREHLPHADLLAVNTTSEAAERVSAAQDPAIAAISSTEAGLEHVLKIVRSDIQDEPENFTRFVVISRAPLEHKGERKKCSLIVELAHTPGSLFRFLETLEKDKANLTKIESRPLAKKPFEYRFYLDFLAGKSGDSILGELEEAAHSLQVLGWYSQFQGS